MRALRLALATVVGTYVALAVLVTAPWVYGLLLIPLVVWADQRGRYL